MKLRVFGFAMLLVFAFSSLAYATPSVVSKIGNQLVTIEEKSDGLIINHGPAGILIDITGAGYTCTGAPGAGPNSVTSCSGGPADVIISFNQCRSDSSQLNCCDCFHPSPIISFHADKLSVTADGLVVNLQAGYNDHVGFMNYVVSPDGLQVFVQDEIHTLMGENFVVSFGRDGMVYCITEPCNSPENSIRINPEGWIIDPFDNAMDVIETTKGIVFFTRDCLDHDHCLQAENNDGAVSMSIFAQLTRIKILFPGMTLKIPRFNATRA